MTNIYDMPLRGNFKTSFLIMNRLYKQNTYKIIDV